MSKSNYRVVLLLVALLVSAVMTYDFVLADGGSQQGGDSSHQFEGTYLITSTGGSSEAKPLVNPTVHRIGERFFLRGTLSSKVGGLKEKFFGKICYIPIDGVTSIQEMDVD